MSKSLMEKVDEFHETRSIALACEIVDEIWELSWVKDMQIFAINRSVRFADFLKEAFEKKESNNEG